MSKKILIFGNGISLRYNYEEYNYKSLAQKFNEGIETSIKLNISNQDLNNEDFKIFYERFKKNSFNFNEGFFFNVFRNLFYSIFIKRILNNERLNSFVDSEDVWDRCYESITTNSEEAFVDHLNELFKSSYQSILYSIQRSVSIDIQNKEWIYIDYPPIFLNNLNSYNIIYTTNYYLGHLNKHHNNIHYLHGEVLRLSDNSLVSKNFKREQTIGGEFPNSHSIFNSKILFGETYEDKIFLNSILNWNRILKRIPPAKNFDFSGSDVDIIGLSTEGDKDLIKEIINQANSVKVYYHTIKDKEEWEKIISKKENCELLPDLEYPGFIGEKKT